MFTARSYTKVFILACWALVMTSGTQLQAGALRHLYVDPRGGSNEASGSHEAPVRSLGALVGRLNPGDTVFLARGRYEEPVRLTDSGTPQEPIVIRNVEGQ